MRYLSRTQVRELATSPRYLALVPADALSPAQGADSAWFHLRKSVAVAAPAVPGSRRCHGLPRTQVPQTRLLSATYQKRGCFGPMTHLPFWVQLAETLGVSQMPFSVRRTIAVQPLYVQTLGGAL